MNQMVQTSRQGSQVIDVEVRTTASPDAVWPLLGTTASWVDWAGFDEAELAEPASPEPEGVGAIRRFRKGRTKSRERVVVYEPGRHFAYLLLEGLPLRDYRGDVTLTPDGSGTVIHWRSTFDPKVRGTGWLYRVALRRFLRSTARSLAQGAERQATSTR
jgi:hypothetical protein